MKRSRTPITATTDTTAVRAFLVSPWNTANSSASSATWSLRESDVAIALPSSKAGVCGASEHADRQDDGKVRHLQRPKPLVVPEFGPHAGANGVAHSACLALGNALAGVHEELGRHPPGHRDLQQHFELRRGHRDVDLEIRGAPLVALARRRLRTQSSRPPCSHCGRAPPCARGCAGTRTWIRACRPRRGRRSRPCRRRPA